MRSHAVRHALVPLVLTTGLVSCLTPHSAFAAKAAAELGDRIDITGAGKGTWSGFAYAKRTTIKGANNPAPANQSSSWYTSPIVAGGTTLKRPLPLAIAPDGKSNVAINIGANSYAPAVSAGRAKALLVAPLESESVDSESGDVGAEVHSIATYRIKGWRSPAVQASSSTSHETVGGNTAAIAYDPYTLAPGTYQYGGANLALRFDLALDNLADFGAVKYEAFDSRFAGSGLSPDDIVLGTPLWSLLVAANGPVLSDKSNLIVRFTLNTDAVTSGVFWDSVSGSITLAKKSSFEDTIARQVKTALTVAGDEATLNDYELFAPTLMYNVSGGSITYASGAGAGLSTVGETVGDAFGRALATTCDFNGDGFADLAIGVPDEDVGSIVDAGAVNVLYGSPGGLTATNEQFWHQDSPGLLGQAEEGDHFGTALTEGDFNGDGFCDLAIGVPGEDLGPIVDAGSVNVLYGSPSGLTAAGNQVWDQNKQNVEGAAEAGDLFGSALAGGDFNGDGFADLAIGVPGESVGAIEEAGAVNVLYGTASGLSAANDQIWDEARGDVMGEAEPGDHFGSALAMADFDADGFADLAIGAPDEDVGLVVDAGAIHVLYGSSRGLSATGDQLWHQNRSGVEGTAEAGDRFGAALAAGDFDHNGFSDLAIGIPGEDVGTVVDAGAVQVLYSVQLPTGPKLSASGDQVWDQARSGVADVPEAGDQFGTALAAGDFDGDGFADLAIGVPGEDVGAIVDAGVVNVLYGTANRLTAVGDQLWHQNTLNVEDVAETGDLFGTAVAVGDFDGDGFADLAIGVPAEDVGSIVDAGAVNVLYGTATNLSAANDQIWDQNTTGIEDAAE